MRFTAFIKVALFFLLTAVFVFNFSFAVKTLYLNNVPTESQGRILIQAPLRVVNWDDIGKVSDPVVDAEVKVASGYKKTSFLLDSGAVISSLPREMADEMGLELAFLKRISFVGFGNQESFAYKGEMVVRFRETEITLPVVFTEGYGTRAILGRQDFFDKYIIVFDKQRGIIEIREG